MKLYCVTIQTKAIEQYFLEVLFIMLCNVVLNTERTYKWKLSGSARQSEIGILCFDWLIHPGVSYSREI